MCQNNLKNMENQTNYPPVQPQQDSSSGANTVLLVLVVILLVGGGYWWYRHQRYVAPASQTPSSVNLNVTLPSGNTTGSCDEVA
jgi:uncharacterized protein HemX